MRTLASVLVLGAALILAGAGSSALAVCGPFTDVSDATFCPFVLEIFTLGITTGTTPTTYDPTATVSRLQMAAFLSRTVDTLLKRSSARAPAAHFWSPQTTNALAQTTVGMAPVAVKFDGMDLWVLNNGNGPSGGGTASRVRASNGNLLDTWTGMTNPIDELVAIGRVVIPGNDVPGKLYAIDPAQPAGAVTTVATSNFAAPIGIAFDGGRFWLTASDRLWIVTPTATLPWTSTTVTTGFTFAQGALYDGSSVWLTDLSTNRLERLDPAGAIVQTVTVGTNPSFPLFDGGSIWVPNYGSDSLTVVRASTGAILATLTGNGLHHPNRVAFDGERILVTSSGDPQGVTLWKAADLTPIGSFLTNGIPTGACSDGVQFWITLAAANKIARF